MLTFYHSFSSFALLLTMFCSAEARTLKQVIAVPFSQVIISDGINIQLYQGSSQQLTIDYINVNPEDIIVEVKGKKLKIYLNGCKNGCKYNQYPNADVQLILSYKELEKLVVKGDNEVYHTGELDREKFILKSYGDNHINFKSIYVQKLKTSLYGDNNLTIERGEVDQIKLKAFGDHKVSLLSLSCAKGKIHAFGDNVFELNISDQLFLTSLGDASIRCQGNPWVDKKLVLGDLSLRVYQ
ncbi:hypothetical protein OKW21_001980 [Catalinimonas alkaloidigena]|uniref:GIN domain-containing protein n=1 Tax=Catalinimonas alkaloidigena TaxID=1075417 RepID=UPI002406CD13|nr:DUF2807 domain-containing protein [Catalinimonas alkaloidigena]MDF9796717.1 hypothetical protein [Catalinimonas alkaloidigena]